MIFQGVKSKFLFLSPFKPNILFNNFSQWSNNGREIFHKSPLKDFVILAVNSVASVIVIKTVGLFTCSGKNIVIVLATACLYGVISVAVFGAINAVLNPSVAKRLMAYARR